MNTRNQYGGRNQANRQSYQQQEEYFEIKPRDYFDNINGEVFIKEDLFSEIANKIAKSFRGKMKGSQLRKFYDDILRRKAIIDLANDEKMEFKKQLPYIKMLLAKVSYAHKRGNVSNNFKRFIEDNIGNIVELKEFFVFCNLFEAVVAYSKQYLSDN